MNDEQKDGFPVKSTPLFDDELFDAAHRLILATGNASIAHLQRKLKIGYCRANSIVNEMERIGIVSKFDGTNPRYVIYPSNTGSDLRGE